jgi:hypothetical protein
MKALATALARRAPRSWGWREASRRLLGLVVTALVLVSTLGAGRTYLWCTMMQERVESCCCASAESERDAGRDQAPTVQNGCCEDHATPAVDLGSVPSDLIEMPAALPAPPLGAPVVVAAPARAAPSVSQAVASLNPRARPIRAGPRSAADTAIRLQVFRC